MDAVPTLAPMLRKLRLWARLDDAQERALLDLPHEVVTLERQRVFVREGDEISHCWLMLSGYCVRFKYVGTGSRQIVSIHMKGDLVDLHNSLLGVADHSVQTLISCKMAKLPIKHVRDLSDREPAIKDALWLDTLVDASIHREWIANLGRRDSRSRIAHLLCEFALKLDAIGFDQLDYELPMTQDQIADATGLTAVHVNRVIQGLASDGLIERASAKSVVIGDWKKLAAAGDFHPAYLHLDILKRRRHY